MAETFVARQPIFDRKEKIFAYELLFRQGQQNNYDFADGDAASESVIANTFISIGIDTLTGGKRGFINFTENLLMNNIAFSLPKDYLGIEILETVEPSEDIINACMQLKEAGYLIVLDDFVFEPKFWPLIKLADIIKVDFLGTNADERNNILQRINTDKIKFLAEKVETKEDYAQAFRIGYSYFQGYFFSKPALITGKNIAPFEINTLRLIAEINSPDFDFERINNLIKGDIALSYNLLRFINSSAFGIRTKINSIKQALVLLGQKEMRKWASIVILQKAENDKPNELLVNSVVRATFGEALANNSSHRLLAADVFLMGLFSMIDAFLDKPLAEVLAELPLATEIKRALLGEDTQMRAFLDIVLAYEKADWCKLSVYAKRLGIEESIIPSLYVKSITEANHFNQ